MSASWINVADAERAAAERLEPGPWGYFSGGAGDEVTLRDNVEAWRRWRLRPRVLVDTSAVSTATELFGAPLATPLLVAPVAYQRLAHPDGEIGMASAAAAAGTVLCLSTLATTTPAELAAAAPPGRRWFQLYQFRDEAVTRALMEEAVDAGFEAIVVTVDAPPGGNRERDLRTGFEIPAGLGVPSVSAALGTERAVTIAETFALMTRAMGWEDFAELAAEAPVPVLVKGVLTAEDAELAVAHGAAGIVVSNHGGRQLDLSIATADALAEIADAVAGRLPVLVDGGIRRGVDAAVALALGADAVLLGRPLLWGLAGGGEAGVARVLEMLRAELELALALCGCTAPRSSAAGTCGGHRPRPYIRLGDRSPQHLDGPANPQRRVAEPRPRRRRAVLGGLRQRRLLDLLRARGHRRLRPRADPGRLRDRRPDLLCTAATYAEATVMYPEAGGSSSFARHAFNEFVSFIAAWGQMLNYTITVAISAYFVPHYLAVFWGPLGESPGDIMGGAVLVTAWP